MEIRVIEAADALAAVHLPGSRTLKRQKCRGKEKRERRRVEGERERKRKLSVRMPWSNFTSKLCCPRPRQLSSFLHTVCTALPQRAVSYEPGGP